MKRTPYHALLLTSGGLRSAVAHAVLAQDPLVQEVHTLRVECCPRSLWAYALPVEDLCAHYKIPRERRHCQQVTWPAGADVFLLSKEERRDLLLTCATLCAKAFGPEKGFRVAYPGCDDELCLALGSTARDVTVFDPLEAHKSLKEVVALGQALGVPWRLTCSCHYQDALTRRCCGRCPGCTARRKVFTEVGVEDPAAY